MRAATIGALAAATASGATLALITAGADMLVAALLGVALAAFGGALADVLRARRAAPMPRPYRSTAAPVPGGGRDALPVGVGRALLDLLPLGLILLDSRGRVIYENGACADLVERRLLGLRGAAALRAPALSEALRAALEEGRDSEVDATLQRSTERIVHAFVRALPGDMSGAEPRPAALVLLEDRTALAKSEALRRDFVANASHELKTPLASISGFIETLQGHAKGDPEAAERFLAIMAAQADRMKRLVDDLISLNRIEMNEHVAPRDPIDVAAAVWEVAGALAPVAEREGARIAVELPESGLVARGDQMEIAQVFVNLMDNALKYAGRDGPIRVYREPTTATRPNMMGVTVADQGPGIAREHLPRLTERFYRVDIARSRERGGTGLGLAIAKHILNRHRGDLTVASVPGRGARFTVWLPEPAAAAQTGEQAA